MFSCTARQVGARAAEHLNNLTQFKLDSFMLGHWLDQHPTDAIPPKFKFKIVSKHFDPLSRQIKEAVMISNQVLLNKRNEFIQNEIIKMQPSQYAWKLAREDMNSKKNEAEREVLLKEFIKVMSNVGVRGGRNDHNMSNFTCNNYRSKQRKRKEAPALSDTKRVKIMDMFSTPLNGRHTHFREAQSPDSSPISITSVLTDSENEGSGLAGQHHTNISNDAENMKLKPREKQSVTQVLASQAVTMESFSDAEYSYMVRRETGLANDESLWCDNLKFKKYVSDNSSFELEVLLNDYSLEWLFHHEIREEVTSASEEEKVFTNDFSLDWLFRQEVEEELSSSTVGGKVITSAQCKKVVHTQEEDEESFYLDNLFKEDELVADSDDEQIEETELMNLIARKRKNSLPEIFKKENSIKINSPKRKRESPEEQVTTKLRRMTIAGDSSPSLRKVGLRRNKSTSSTGRKGLYKLDKADVGPKQLLISKFLEKKTASDQ